MRCVLMHLLLHLLQTRVRGACEQIADFHAEMAAVNVQSVLLLVVLPGRCSAERADPATADSPSEPKIQLGKSYIKLTSTRAIKNGAI